MRVFWHNGDLVIAAESEEDHKALRSAGSVLRVAEPPPLNPDPGTEDLSVFWHNGDLRVAAEGEESREVLQRLADSVLRIEEPPPLNPDLGEVRLVGGDGQDEQPVAAVEVVGHTGL